MSIINNGLLLASGADAPTTYQISRSLRFNSADSAYLSRTPGSAGSRTTWTWSAWVKRSKLGAAQEIWGAYTGTGNDEGLFYATFESDDKLYIYGWSSLFRKTTQVFRDVSAWYHIVIVADVTNGTANNRLRIYVNGTEITTFDTITNPASTSQFAINSASAHYIGADPYSPSSRKGDYMLADVYLLDGTATTPSTFAETDAITGQWVPKTPTGISYGTNGFRLTFSDNSGTTSTTLGKDAAGSNNWTPNNFSVASGSGNDSLVDSPTSYGTDTGAGGEVRGNFCTWNPLGTAGPASSNGNLDIASSSTAGNKIGTFLLTSGKWYWECSGDGYAGAVVGVGGEGFTGSMSSSGSKAIGYWFGGGIYWDGGSFTSGIASYTTTDVIGVAVDMTAGTVAFYKNNTLVYTATFGSGTVPNLSSGVYPGFNTGNPGGSARTVIANFGQRAFAYTAPSGFKALCDTNLTAPTIAKPANYFDALLWTGNSTNGRAITGLAFQPEFVWIKRRSASYSNLLFDAVRGFGGTGWTKQLISDSTAAEDTGTTNTISSFDTGGFTLGTDGGVNSSGSTYVGWCWDAAGSNSTNTSGTITSTVRANATAGFSVVTYTGNGSAGATYGHGLGVAPKLIITKRRDSAQNWVVQPNGDGTKYLFLNLTDAQYSDSSPWNNTNPSSTLVTLGTAGVCNANGATYVSYAFAPVTNYSAFGSYTGNGSSDGPFVFTGHRSRWLMVKRSDSGANDWYVLDTARSTYNVAINELLPNSSSAENPYTGVDFDLLSNGFKIRATEGSINASGGTFIYASFAEFPFAYARAR